MSRAVFVMGSWVFLACAESTSFPRPPHVEFAPTTFYSRRLDDGRIPILAHASVSERALAEAKARLNAMLHDAPRIRRNLEAQHYELHVLGLEQFPSDLPEYTSKRGNKLWNGELFDWHMIGGHLSETRSHYSSCTEGTLLPVVGFRLFADETCFHELAHAIEWFALDANTRARVDEEFSVSTKSGLWKDAYAATSASEWFAEISKYYFRPDRPDLAFYDAHVTKGHDWFCSYDARACAFAHDLYGDRIDPGTPKTVTVTPTSASLGVKSADGRVPVRVVVRNAMRERIHIVWIDYDGKRDTRRTFADAISIAPGGENAQFTYATHVFVVTDDAEKALCTFTAPAEEGIVDIAAPCP